MVRNWLIAAGCLVILGILGMAVYGFDFAGMNANRVDVEKRWAFEQKGLESLYVDGGSLDMNVAFIPSEDGRSGYVEVSGTVDRRIAEKLEAAQISGKMLHLDMNADWRNFDLFAFGDRRLDVTVALPEQERLETVRFGLRSGNGSYSGVKGKHVRIGASSGNVKFTGLEAAERIELESRSGNIKGSGIAGSAQVTVGSGNITIDGLAGDAIVKSGSGDIAVKQRTVADMDVQARSGNVTIDVAEGFAGFYDLRASSGNIHAPDSKHQTLDTVKVRTGSGNITVRETAVE